MKFADDIRGPGFAVGLLLFALLGVTALALLQGINGPFIIDDWENLDGLERISADPSLESYLKYVLNGISSPLGRPLALLSFALQHESWPKNPEDFIYVNVLIHLLNGTLLFGCLVRVLGLMSRPPTLATYGVALAATAFWMLAAPQASAVLYIVQRMAELAGTFVLLGLLLYLTGRKRELEGRPLSGFALMISGLGVAVPLGYLVKETVALFPMLVLVLEYTLLRHLPRSRHWRAFGAACLWLPAAVVGAYLLSYIPHFNAAANLRPFTLVERLLTEARVLFMYLGKALFPPLYGIRLYYDDLPISHSLLDPWTTLASIAGWTALATLAVRFRARAPVFSFAVLWYLGGHLIEATFIPLELAFDHRAYIPLVGPALALAWYGERLLESPALARIRPVIAGGAVLYGALLAGTTWQAAALWGRPWELAHFWAVQQPDSRRAQLGLEKFFWHANMPDEAVKANEHALAHWPGDVSFFLGVLETGCAFPKLPKPDLNRIVDIVKVFDSTVTSTVGMLDILVTDAELQGCHRYSPSELWEIVQMTFDTPKLAPQEQNRLLLLSRVADLANDRRQARELLDRAIDTGPAPSPYMFERAVSYALHAGDVACADHYLHRYETVPMSPLHRWSYQTQLDRLKDWRDRTAAAPGYAARPGDLPSCGGVQAGAAS